MLSLQTHLSQTTLDLAVTEGLDVRTVLTGVLLFGVLAFAALLEAAWTLVSQAIRLLKEAFRLLALTLMAGLIVAMVVIIAYADLLAR